MAIQVNDIVDLHAADLADTPLAATVTAVNDDGTINVVSGDVVRTSVPVLAAGVESIDTHVKEVLTEAAGVDVYDNPDSGDTPSASVVPVDTTTVSKLDGVFHRIEDAIEAGVEKIEEAFDHLTGSEEAREPAPAAEEPQGGTGQH
jgi:hypothetical protein